MLDSKEQSKGGFGAFAAREREGRDAQTAAGNRAATSTGAAVAASSAVATPSVDGSASPTAAARMAKAAEPHEPRFFRGLR